MTKHQWLVEIQGHLQTAAGCGDCFTDAIQSTWYAATGHEKLEASAWSCAFLGGFSRNISSWRGVG